MAILDLMSLARLMIAIDTSGSRSDLPLIEFLLPLCRAAGLRATLQEEVRDGVKQFNLIASRRSIDSKTLLLTAHVDTVSPGDHGRWTATGGAPFALTEREGVLYGLGVADVKLDLLSKILALEALRGVQLRDNVGVAATYGEETGRYGAKLLVRELRAREGEAIPRRALVGEPTGLRPCTAHKGYAELRTEGTDVALQRLASSVLRWRILFTGCAAHSSQPHLGASANRACLDALALLPGWAIVSVQGGDAVNKVAHRCEAVVAGPEPPPAGVLARTAAASGVSWVVEPEAGAVPPLWSPDVAGLLIKVHSLTRDFERRTRALEARGYDPPYTTVNNGLVGLDQGRFSYVADVRSIPGRPTTEMLDAHEAALRRLERPDPPYRKGLWLRTQRTLESAPFHAPPDSELLAALLVELAVQGLRSEPEMKSGTTEAPVYREAGMDTLVFGPGEAAGNIHRPNEHVALADLHRCIDIYRGLVLRLCGG